MNSEDTDTVVHPQVMKLLNLPQPAQRTTEWFKARESRITASAVSSLLVKDEITCKNYTSLYGLEDIFDYDNKCCNPYSSKQQFTMSKINQTFTGSIATYHGQKYEEIATRIYEVISGSKVLDFGLIQHQAENWIAASPDGITTNGIMLEIKCPYRRKITGIPPLYYYQQVQIQLEVCDLEYCDFLECEIIEVGMMKEFIDDSLHDTFIPYKGVLVQIEQIPDTFETRQYIYPPKELINDAVKSSMWASRTVLNIIEERNLEVLKETDVYTVCINEKYQKFNIRTVFWKCSTISCVRIQRDREWWTGVKGYLKKNWDDVVYFKNNYIGAPPGLSIPKDDDCLF